MRVLLLAEGPVDYSVAFANGLAPHVATTMIAPAGSFGDAWRWVDPAVDLDLVRWPRHRSPGNLAFLWRLGRMMRRARPDVVHLMSNNVLWMNLAAPFWRAVPVVTTVHDVSLHPGDRDTAKLPEWAPRMMARRSPDIVVHGPGLAKLAAEAFEKPEDRVHVLPHPAITRYVELARRDGMTAAPRREGFHVLLFGRIFAYKGLDLLIEAERLLGDRIPGLTITIAGRGDDPAILRERMGDPGRYDIRHRFIEERETAQLFCDADVVALPYAEGSQSGVLHVAASFGRPVVVTDVGELGPTVAANGVGFVVRPQDPQALADALARLAEDAELRRRLGAAALSWSEGANAPATIGAAAAELYRGILQR